MLISVRRTVAALAATGIVLAACGTTEEASTDTAGVPATPAAASDEPALTPSESDNSEVATEAPAETEAPTDDEPVAEPETPVESDATAEQVDETPAATEPALATPEAVIGGRALASELAAASDFDENALPDIQVDDVRRQMKVNLRNVFPAERPVLIWMWAPH